jgi:hypothetical protein
MDLSNTGPDYSSGRDGSGDGGRTVPELESEEDLGDPGSAVFVSPSRITLLRNDPATRRAISRMPITS